MQLSIPQFHKWIEYIKMKFNHINDNIYTLHSMYNIILT